MSKEIYTDVRSKISKNLISPRQTYRLENNDAELSSDDDNSIELNPAKSRDDSLCSTSSPSPKIQKKAKTELNIDRVSEQDLNHRKDTKCWRYVLIGLFALAISTLLFYMIYGNVSVSEPVIDINSLKTEFPRQSEDLWYGIEGGISDVNTFKRPVVFMFMYNDDTKKVTNNLITRVAAIAISNFTNQKSLEPINLDNKELNSEQVLKDYGILIDKYKPLLKEKHVMVVRDVQNIPGIVAQVFHTYCDEFTPAVEKSMFIFTIDTTGRQGSNSEIVENVLREKWTKLGTETLTEDIFIPLFARITSMIVRVNAEKENLYLKDL